jgi:hypothetical protein
MPMLTSPLHDEARSLGGEHVVEGRQGLRRGGGEDRNRFGHRTLELRSAGTVRGVRRGHVEVEPR